MAESVQKDLRFRCGRVLIPQDILETWKRDLTQYPKLRQWLNQGIIVKAELLEAAHCMKYYMYHPEFEVLEPGVKPPYYNLYMEHPTNGGDLVQILKLGLKV